MKWRRSSGRNESPTIVASAVTATLDEWIFTIDHDSTFEAVLVTDQSEQPLVKTTHGGVHRVVVTGSDLAHHDATVRGRLELVSGKQRRIVSISDTVTLPRQSPLATDEGSVASFRVTRGQSGAVLTWRWIAGKPAATIGTDLVRWGGLDSHENVLTSSDVMTGNLVHVSTTLTAAGLEHLVTNETWQAGHILVARENLLAAHTALTEHQPDASWQIEHTDSDITVFRSVVTPGRSVHLARALATRVIARDQRLWPRPDSELIVNESPLPVHSGSRQRSVQSAPDPIDGLWTWVDSNDPDWRRSRDAMSGGAQVAANSVVDSRFDDHDELRYSLRSAHEFAPWLRQLVILTADQVPTWLDENHPRIRIVSHRDIFDAEHLPTFNSHAIEAHFHRIDALSEHFLYFNDDVFLGRPVSPDQFFGPTGSAKVFRSPTPIPHTPIDDEDSGFYAARKNNRRLIEREFGVTIHHGYLHTTHSLRKDVLADLATRFPQEWAGTANSRFRSFGDIAVASSLHHDVAIMTGRGHDGVLASKYVKAGCASDEAIMLEVFLKRNRDIFCLNDTADRDLPRDRQRRQMNAFMKAYFPTPAPWELDRVD